MCHVFIEIDQSGKEEREQHSNPVGKGLGVGVNAAGFRSCTSLTGGRDEEVNRNLLSRALAGMLWGFD